MAVPYHIEKKNTSIPWKKLGIHATIGLGLGGILAILLRIFVYEPIRIETVSMEPSLQKGKSYQLKKWSRTYQIGDVVLCKLDSGSVLARIIAKAGDTLSIQSKVVYRNGDSIPKEVYPIQEKDSRPALPVLLTNRDNMEPIRIPEGHFFLLGDNRDEALDSRTLGSLPSSCILGKFSI